MHGAHTPAFLVGDKRTRAPRPARPRQATLWSSERAKPVEIVAHDEYCTALLLEHATPFFPAEIVSGPAWIVRVQPPAGGGRVLELLSLVERWLEAARLPCAKVLYGDRSYLVRTPVERLHHAPQAVTTFDVPSEASSTTPASP